jgi:Cu-Zn family superoxide dismutase
MKKSSGVLLLLAAAGFGSGAAQRVTREGILHDATGKEVGRVELQQKSGAVVVIVHAQGLPPGLHGMHLHEAGQCEPPAFQSAGAHYNPHNREHGRRNTRGAHLGDLGNLRIGSNGRGSRTVTIADSETRKGLVSLLGPGRSLVIHADPDDDRTDPSGNSGARIACAVVK